MVKNIKADPVDIHVGSKVRFRRKILGISQSKLAEGLGITFQQVQKYESGANRIGSSRLYQISQLLGVSIAFFFDDLPNEITNQNNVAMDNAEENMDLEILDNKETLDLLRNYYSIKSQHVRKNINYLIRSITR